MVAVDNPDLLPEWGCTARYRDEFDVAVDVDE
jgi:hypothetical protein